MNAPQTSYELSAAERQMVQQIQVNTLAAKSKIYDLQAGLEAARMELAGAQHAMNGAVSMLAHANGLKQATLTEDFTRLNGAPQEKS